MADDIGGNRRTLRVGAEGQSSIRAVSEAIKNVNSNLRSTTGAAAGAAESTNHTSRRMRELAASSGEASGGLATLQANLASTRVAQEALREETDSTQDALNKLLNTAHDGDSAAATKIVDEMARDLHGSVGDVEEFDNALGEMMESFDEDQMNAFLEAYTGVKTEVNNDKISFKPTDDLNETQRAFAAIEEQADYTLDELAEYEDVLSDIVDTDEGDLDFFEHDIDQDLAPVHEGIDDFWNVRSIRDQFEDAGFEDVQDIADAHPAELLDIAPREFDLDESIAQAEEFNTVAGDIVDTALPEHVESLDDMDFASVDDLDFEGLHPELEKFVTGEGEHAGILQEAMSSHGFEDLDDLVGTDGRGLMNVAPDSLSDDEALDWANEIIDGAEEISEQFDYLGTQEDLFDDVMQVPGLDLTDHFTTGKAGDLEDELGFESIRDVANATADDLMDVYGIGEGTAPGMVETAEDAVQGYEDALTNVDDLPQFDIPSLDIDDQFDGDFASQMKSTLGFEDVTDVASSNMDELQEIYGVGPATAEEMLEESRDILAEYDHAIQETFDIEGMNVPSQIDRIASPDASDQWFEDLDFVPGQDMPSPEMGDVVDDETAATLADDLGLETVEDLASATTDELTELEDVETDDALMMITEAEGVLERYQNRLDLLEGYESPLATLDDVDMSTFQEDLFTPLDELDDGLGLDPEAISALDDAGFESLHDLAQADSGELISALEDGIDWEGIDEWTEGVVDSAQELEEMGAADFFGDIFAGEESEFSLPLRGDEIGDLTKYGIEDDVAKTIRQEYDTVGDVLEEDASGLKETALGEDVDMFNRISAEDVLGDDYQDVVADHYGVETAADLLDPDDVSQMHDMASDLGLGEELSDEEAAVSKLLDSGYGEWGDGGIFTDDDGSFANFADGFVDDAMQSKGATGAGGRGLPTGGARKTWINQNSDFLRERLTAEFEASSDAVIPDDTTKFEPLTGTALKDELYGRFQEYVEQDGYFDAPPLEALESDFDGKEFQQALREGLPDFDSDDQLRRLQEGIGDEEMSERMQSLVRLMDSNENIRRAILDADGFDDALRNIDKLDPENLAKLSSALLDHGESVNEYMDGTEDILGLLGEFDSKSELMGRIDEELNTEIGDAQLSILSDTLMDLDEEYIPEGEEGFIQSLLGPGPSAIPSRDTVEMGLLGEYMDTDSDERRQDIQNLLSTLHQGELGLTDPKSLIDSDSFLGTGNVGAEPGTLREDLEGRLRLHFPDNEDLVQDLATDAVEGLKGTEGVGSIGDLTGPGSEGSVSQIVGDALDFEEYSDVPEASEILTQEMGESLRSAQRQQATRIAPGLVTGLEGTDDFNLQELLFGTGRGKGVEGKHISSYLDNVNEAMDAVSAAQDSSELTRGLGHGGRRRGLIGYALYGADRVLDGQGRGAARHLDRLRSGLEGVNNRYGDMIPLLETTSLNLGAMNVSFESMGIMIFKITAMLGPAIAGLIGFASASLAAAGALGAFAAIGGIGFLGQMEQDMAGVNDKGEAMQELMGTIKDMAWEATQPLQEVRLGDGRSGMQFFVDSLRGSLILLNRMSEVLAGIVGLPVFTEELDRVSDAIFNEGEGDWMENLGNAVEDVLPVLSELAVIFVNALPGFIAYVSEITKDIGPELIDMLQEISDVMGHLTKYGAGFMQYAIWAIGMIAKGLSGILDYLDVFYQYVLLVPLLGDAMGALAGDTYDLAFGLGAVIGALEVFRRATIYTVKNLYGLYRVGRAVTIMLHGQTAAAYASAGSWQALGLSMARSLVHFTAIALAVLLIADLLFDLSDSTEAFMDAIPVFGEWDTWLGRITNSIIIAAGAIVMYNKYLAATVARLLGVQTATVGATAATRAFGIAVRGAAVAWGAIQGAVTVIGGAIAGVSATTVGLVAIVAGLLLLLADFANYVITGESHLSNWFPILQDVYDVLWEVLQIAYLIIAPWEDFNSEIDDTLDKLEDVVEYLEQIPGVQITPTEEEKAAREEAANDPGPMEERLGLSTSEMLNYAGPAGTMFQTGSAMVDGAQSGGSERSYTEAGEDVVIEIVNNGLIGQRDLDRMVERSVRDLFGRGWSSHD